MKQEFKTRVMIAAVDFIACFISLFAALFVLQVIKGDVERFLPMQQYIERILMHGIVAVISVVWFSIFLRHYTYRKPLWLELREILHVLFVLAILELAIIAFSKSHISRYLWGGTWGFVFLFVPLGRIIIHKILLNTGWLIRDTVIIGNKRNALDTYMALISEPYLGFDVKAFVGDDGLLPVNVNIPVIAEEKKLLKLFDGENTQFIIALEQEEFDKHYEWLRFFSKHKCRMVSVVPSMRGVPLYGTDISFLFSYDVMLLRINNNLARISLQWLKRGMDIIGAGFISIIVLPFLIPFCFLISLDGGLPLYAQARVGRNKKVFKCYKFRSMRKNADKQLRELLENDEQARQEWERDFKLKNDPRITKVGRFLRATSLDELPQLFNVIKGDMSLVGPRPIVRQELKKYDDDLDYYLMVRPGMTGLWQISGRSNVDYDTRVYFDAWYVKNWSIWFDIAILFKTVKIVIKKVGAY